MLRAIKSNKRHHAVQHYSCLRVECIFYKFKGYLIRSLNNRLKMRKRNGLIIKHLGEVHENHEIPRNYVLIDTGVLATVRDWKKLILTEAVLIKMKKPNLNSVEKKLPYNNQIYYSL